MELADAGDYAGALVELEAAGRVFEAAKVVYNVASCLRALGRRSKALSAFERVVELGTQSLPPASRANPSRYVEEPRGQVALLTVRTNVRGAAVTVDGRAVRRWPLAVEPGGAVTVAARRRGYREAREVARPLGAGPFEVLLELERERRLVRGAAETAPGPDDAVRGSVNAARGPSWRRAPPSAGMSSEPLRARLRSSG